MTRASGVSRQIVIAGRDGELRARHMTPREYARLMGVADDFKIDVPVN
jgi:site-specific DNA-cytosine methylase